MRFIHCLPLASRLQRAWQRLPTAEQSSLHVIRQNWETYDYQTQIDFLSTIKGNRNFKEFTTMEIATIFKVYDESEM